MTLSPAEVEALLWAAASATGPGAFPEELLPPLGQAEAQLLLALLRAAVHPTTDEEQSAWRCPRCGQPWPRCRCRRGKRSAADGLEPGGQDAPEAPSPEGPEP